MASECAVCYNEEGSFQKLCCGHTFCKSCIKSWYHKGACGSSCPMCRKPMYWRGFHQIRDAWDREAWEGKCAEVFSEALDERFAEAQEFAEAFSAKWRARIFKEVIDDFMDIEKTYRFLKSECVDPEVMEDAFYWGDYYSDRHINKYSYLDEPPKDLTPALQFRGRGKGFKRARARQDPWVTLSFYIEV